MKIKTIRRDFIIGPEACDEISDLIMEFCESIGVDRKDALRYRLSAEECIICEEVNLLVQFLMEIISRLVPW